MKTLHNAVLAVKALFRRDRTSSVLALLRELPCADDVRKTAERCAAETQAVKFDDEEITRRFYAIPEKDRAILLAYKQGDKTYRDVAKDLGMDHQIVLRSLTRSFSFLRHGGAYGGDGESQSAQNDTEEADDRFPGLYAGELDRARKEVRRLSSSDGEAKHDSAERIANFRVRDEPIAARHLGSASGAAAVMPQSLLLPPARWDR